MAEATVDTATKSKGKQVNTTITAELHERLDNHRWEARIERFSDLVRIALEEYAENHGL